MHVQFYAQYSNKKILYNKARIVMSWQRLKSPLLKPKGALYVQNLLFVVWSLGLGKKGKNIKTYFFYLFGKNHVFTFLAYKKAFFPFWPKIEKNSRLRRKNKPFLGSFFCLKLTFCGEIASAKEKYFLFRLQNYFLLLPIKEKI